MNILETRIKIKSFAEPLKSKEFYTVLLIVFVGLSSFGLGRLSKLEESKMPISIYSAAAFSATSSARGVGGGGGRVANDEDLTIKDSAISAGGKIVASKTGTKYHYPWCAGAQRISEANKVWFNSVEEARKAGYTPAGNCKGLK